MVKDAERTLYGYDDIEDDTLIWTEGEIDKLSIEVAGLTSCVSVPNGASDKLDFLESIEDRLQEIKIHVLALDNDEPGKKLQQELIRRLGPEKCKLVHWPDGCKDANDVLLQLGKAALANCIEAAEPWPIAGLYDVEHYADQVRTLYQQGEGKGLSTGYECVDQLFTIKPMVYVITGVPSMGKSEFLDQILFNLSQKYDWRHAICSFENPPPMHVAKLLEKTLGKPFHEGPTPRMSEEEMERGMAWVQDHFLFMEQIGRAHV